MSEQRKKRKTNSLIPVVIFLSLSVLLVLVICFVLSLTLLSTKEGGFFSAKKEKASEYASDEPIPVTYSQAEVDEMLVSARETGASEKETEIKEMIRAEAESKNPSLATILRRMYPEYMVYSGDGTFYFQELDENIPANPYARENFVTQENGYRFYEENGTRKSVLCIDVSSHQGAIDWPQVASSGVGAAMIRAGYRGYGSGKMVEDETALANIAGARANNIETGLYFFSQAVNEAEIDEEVDVLLQMAAEGGVNGPIAIDVEKLDDSSARGNALSKEDRTHLVEYFCEKITAAGYEPMIYGNAYSLFHMLDYSRIYRYKTWYAFYSDFMYFPYQVDSWQYSNTGSVPGIKGNVDLNVRFVP